MEAFLVPPNSLLSIDLPGIFPLSHIPPFQTSLKKTSSLQIPIIFHDQHHSPLQKDKKEKEENQHFYKASWVQGHMTFSMSFY